jgi:hypothetical protein
MYKISLSIVGRFRLARSRWNYASEAKRREITGGFVDLPWDYLSPTWQVRLVNALGGT